MYQCLCANENFLMSRWHRGLTNFKVCPLVGAVLNVKNKLGSIMSKPLQILKTSIKSQSQCTCFQCRYIKMFRRSLYDLFFKFGIILVALRCSTPSIKSISFWRCGLQAWTQFKMRWILRARRSRLQWSQTLSELVIVLLCVYSIGTLFLCFISVVIMSYDDSQASS